MRIFQCVLLLVALACLRVLAGDTATATAMVTSGIVSGITVTSGGSGYFFEPSVTITGGGGSGATAKAVLNGDKVATVLILTAGTGYTSPPQVTIGAPLSLRVDPVLKVTVAWDAGSHASVEWAPDPSGPWTAWKDIAVNDTGSVVVDTLPGSSARFFRVVPISLPRGKLGFVWIQPGTFLMGSPPTEFGRSTNETQRFVVLTQGFWLSDHEVTQGEYQAVMGTNPSKFAGNANRPVENVTWSDAALYCQKLTERERAAGRITALEAYRLPTEAEWEYAARAGTTGPRYGDLDAIAWWNGNSAASGTQPVKQKQPNAWGLYDMLGNVTEWCSDWFGPYLGGSVATVLVVNPTGVSNVFFVPDPMRVLRGGAWPSTGQAIRSGARSGYLPDSLPEATSPAGYMGFRPALSSVQ